jgi:hypothetical protein
MAIMLLLLVSIAYALTPTNKEDACYLLSSHLVRSNWTEIKEHIKQFPKLKEPELRFKVIEDGFYYCMGRITQDDLAKMVSDQRKEYSRYLNLVNYPIHNYIYPEQLKLSDDFLKTRDQVSDRISSNSRTPKTNDL